jgi:hypothetical protein
MTAHRRIRERETELWHMREALLAMETENTRLRARCAEISNTRIDDDGHIRDCGNGGEDPRDCSPACANARKERQPMARKPGRPPRSDKPATERIEVRLTKDERKAWERAAGKRTLSDWLRDIANAATVPTAVRNHRKG